MVPTDAELVLRARNDEMTAYQQLVDRYKKKVYFTALGVVGNHHDAEDVLQEALLQALRSLSRLRHPVGFGAWLLRITFNRAIDYCRKKRREVSPDTGENGEEIFDRIESKRAGSNPETVVRSAEISKIVSDTLDTLPDSQRNAFMLKHVANLSIREIATTTNSTESTVKTNIYRAVQRLRKELLPLMVQGADLPGMMNHRVCEP